MCSHQREAARFRQRVARFELTSSPTDPFTTDPRGVNLAISPDGSRIVYTARRGKTSQLVMRRLDRLEATPIAGTEEAFEPFFSPDGQHIAFQTRGELKRVAVEGGPSVAIAGLASGKSAPAGVPIIRSSSRRATDEACFASPRQVANPRDSLRPTRPRGKRITSCRRYSQAGGPCCTPSS